MNKVVALVLIFLIGFVAASPINNARVKRQYGMGRMGGMGMNGMGGMSGGNMGGLTPEQMIANRELAISQEQTRRAVLASEIATNQARVLGAEARLAAVEGGMMMGGRRMGGMGLGMGGIL